MVWLASRIGDVAAAAAVAVVAAELAAVAVSD